MYIYIQYIILYNYTSALVGENTPFCSYSLKYIEINLADQPSLEEHKASILCAMQYPQHNLCRPSLLTYLREPSVRKKYRMPAKLSFPRILALTETKRHSGTAFPRRGTFCYMSLLLSPKQRAEFAMHLKLVIECNCRAQFKFECILTSYWYRSQLYPT